VRSVIFLFLAALSQSQFQSKSQVGDDSAIGNLAKRKSGVHGIVMTLLSFLSFLPSFLSFLPAENKLEKENSITITILKKGQNKPLPPWGSPLGTFRRPEEACENPNPPPSLPFL
jgi:hypothetical protein